MAGVCDFRLLNIICLGLAFTLVFTAFQTCSMVEQTVIKSAQLESNSTFTGDGYTSLSIIYGVFAASNWFAPSVIAVIGSKMAMFIGGICYCLFILSFLKPMTWLLYLASVLVGFGAAVIWTGQGAFLTVNSDKDTIGRNSGIFWALLQTSLLFGNLYIYLAFRGTETISRHQRVTLFTILSVVGAVGVLLLLLLRNKPSEPNEESEDQDEEIEGEDDTRDLMPAVNSQSEDRSSPTAWDALKKSFALIRTPKMLLLCICFAYTGFELAFWSGVLGTCVAATQRFGADAKGLLGLVGILVGAGEIVGGGLFGLMGKRTNTYGRDPIVVLGYVTHMVAVYLIYISLPADSPLVIATSAPTFITPRVYVILICAFLLGFGDSSFNTQIFSILGTIYPDDSAPAFAIFKFVQSIASALSFVYSQYLLLPYQLLILVVFGTAGVAGFVSVEWSVKRNMSQEYHRQP